MTKELRSKLESKRTQNVGPNMRQERREMIPRRWGRVPGEHLHSKPAVGAEPGVPVGRFLELRGNSADRFPWEIALRDALS